MKKNARQGRYARRVKPIILTRIGFMITVLKNGLRRGKCARMSCVRFQEKIIKQETPAGTGTGIMFLWSR